MKQKLFLGFALFLFSPLLVLALSVPGELNWGTSTIRIEFTPDAVVNPPAFDCFHLPNNPLTVPLSNISFSEGNTSQEINDCFQQAGDYVVTITLKDTAGNSSEPTVYNFKILPSSPDGDQTTITASGCNVLDEGGKKADNADPCEVSLTIRDYFGNPVSQIGEAKLWSENDEEINNTDANTETTFREGLRYQDTIGNPEAIPLDNSGDNNLTNFLAGVKAFDLTAIAPSIAKYGWLSQLVERVLGFSIEVPMIDEAGAVSEETSILGLNIPLVFRHLFSVNIDSEEENDFRWEGDDGAPGTLKISRNVVLDGVDPNTITLINRNTGFVSYYEPENPNGCQLLCSEEALLEGCRPCGNQIIDDNHSFNELDQDQPDVTLPVIAAPTNWDEGVEIDGNSNLSFTADILYEIDNLPVSYPAGGVSLNAELNEELDPEDAEAGTLIGYGDSDLGLQIIGADIEGGIMGDKENMVVQAVNNEDYTFTVGGISAQDLRENINENATRLIRGNSNSQDDDFDDDGGWFNESNVAVVEGDVNMPADIELPTGKNTLIIKNGNLIIGSDLVYTNPENDSFGVILINDDPTEYPENGNIFVRSDVTKLVGTYFADGGIMSTDDEIPDARGNGNNLEGNTNQLVLTGTLFTKNTLGGSILKRDGAFHTPWGPTEGETPTDKAKARNYDLHFVRRYPGEEVEGAVCSDISDGVCDTNTNAFVIRIDRKASELPPPGFESTGSFGR